jgi:hypothetical protein
MPYFGMYKQTFVNMLLTTEVLNTCIGTEAPTITNTSTLICQAYRISLWNKDFKVPAIMTRNTHTSQLRSGWLCLHLPFLNSVDLHYTINTNFKFQFTKNATLPTQPLIKNPTSHYTIHTY